MKTAITSILVLLSLLTFGENKWTFTAKDKKVIEKSRTPLVNVLKNDIKTGNMLAIQITE